MPSLEAKRRPPGAIPGAAESRSREEPPTILSASASSSQAPALVALLGGCGAAARRTGRRPMSTPAVLERTTFRTSLFEEVQLAERYDLAIMSTKGMSVTASRELVEELCAAHAVPLLILHDFDKAVDVLREVNILHGRPSYTSVSHNYTRKSDSAMSL
jgi:hypothetical protein